MWTVPVREQAVAFFGDLKKPQIISILSENGLTGAASDALKMKKSDAAELAETIIARHLPSWVPVWMRAPDAKKPLPDWQQTALSALPAQRYHQVPGLPVFFARRTRLKR